MQESEEEEEESSESFQEEAEDKASSHEDESSDKEDEADAEAVASSLRAKRAGKQSHGEADCARLCREGGNDFVKFMLAQAAGSPAISKLPIKSPKEWTFHHLS